MDRSYRWNYEHGPSYGGPAPPSPRGPWKELLGLRVRSRLGVSAGILLNSRWVERYSRLGFDVLTYKTVRSRARRAYPLPNWVYLEDVGRAALRDRGRPIQRATSPPAEVSRATSAVCFGMPSKDPSVWRRDVRKARRLLRPGQVLIVSVVGTPLSRGSAEGRWSALVEDFVRCARWAAEAGADIVEANYSCPNVDSAEGSIYASPERSRSLTLALRDALPATPLCLKVGHFERGKDLDALVDAVGGLADALCLVNGIARRVVEPGGGPTFPGHETVGLLGHGLHPFAVDHVRRATRRLRAKRLRGLATQVLAVGGLLDEGSAARLFAAGAVAALSGSGAALDPLLAYRLKRAHPEW